MKEVLENIFYFVDFGQQEIDCNKISEYPIVINYDFATNLLGEKEKGVRNTKASFTPSFSILKMQLFCLKTQ